LNHLNVQSVVSCLLFGQAHAPQLGVREERVKPDETRLLELFKGYLKEVRKLATLSDSWGG